MLDAPLGRTPKEAEEGKLSTYVGGDPETRSAGSIEDFTMAEEVVQDAWTRVVTYLEREWQRTLLPAVSAPS